MPFSRIVLCHFLYFVSYGIATYTQCYSKKTMLTHIAEKHGAKDKGKNNDDTTGGYGVGDVEGAEDEVDGVTAGEIAAVLSSPPKEAGPSSKSPSSSPPHLDLQV